MRGREGERNESKRVIKNESKMTNDYGDMNNENKVEHNNSKFKSTDNDYCSSNSNTDEVSGIGPDDVDIGYMS